MWSWKTSYWFHWCLDDVSEVAATEDWSEQSSPRQVICGRDFDQINPIFWIVIDVIEEEFEELGLGFVVGEGWMWDAELEERDAEVAITNNKVCKSRWRVRFWRRRWHLSERKRGKRELNRVVRQTGDTILGKLWFHRYENKVTFVYIYKSSTHLY